MKKIFFGLIFTLLIYLAVFPRITEVIGHNYLFLIDQGRDYEAVKKIVADHKLTLIGSEVGSGMAGFRGVFQGPFHYYFLTIPFFLFGGDPYGGVVLMFIFGLLSIVVSFILGRKILGFFGGWLMAVMVAISPPLISHSRFVWNPHPSAFFIVLAFLFTFLSYTKNKWTLFLAAFFSGFLYNFEIPISAPLCIGLLVYAVFVLRLRKWQSYIFLFLGFLAAYSPMILFDIRHGFSAIKGIVEYLFSHSFPQETHTFFADHRGEFIHNFFDTFPKQTLISQAIFFIFYFVSSIFLIISEKRRELKQFLIYLLIIIVVSFIMFSFLKNIVFMYYLVHLNIAYIFFFVYIILSSHEQKKRIIQIFSIIIFLVFLFHAAIFAWENYSKDVNDYGGMSKIKGKIEAIDYIYKDAHGEKFGLLVFSPPVYTYPYDYLIWWYGRNRYNYVPHKEKKGLFYLLIEPDIGKPWSYNGWLETVIKTGEVKETKKLPSGFIIQKRIGGNDER